MEKEVIQLRLNTRITENKLTKELGLLENFKREKKKISAKFSEALNFALEMATHVENTKNLVDYDRKINTLSQLDSRTNYDFTSFDFNQFGKNIEKADDIMDISSMNKILEYTFDKTNSIEYVLRGNLDVTEEDPILEKKDIIKLIQNLGLQKKIDLTNGYDGFSAQIRNLASVSEKKAKLAYNNQLIDELEINIKDIANVAVFARILASIEKGKEERITKKIEYQYNKVIEAQNELKYKRKLESNNEIKLKLEKELHIESEKIIEFNKNKKDKLNLTLTEINNELKMRNKELSTSTKLAKFILDRISIIEKDIIIQDISDAAKKEQQEILDLVKLNIYSKEEIEDKIKKKYKKKEREYQLEFDLNKCEKELKELKSRIVSNENKQAVVMKTIIIDKDRLNIESSKAISHNTLIVAKEEEYKINNSHSDIDIKSLEEYIENKIKEELYISEGIKHLERQLTTQIDLQNSLKTQIDTLDKLEEDTTKKNLVENKQNEIDKIKTLINANHYPNLKNLKSRYDLVINEKKEKIDEKYKLLEIKDEYDDTYNRSLRDLKEEYDRLLIEENARNIKYISSMLKLVKLSDNNILLQKDVLMLNKKKETILSREILYIEELFNGSIYEIKKIVETSVKIKKQENMIKNDVKLAQDNIRDFAENKNKKITNLQKKIANETDKNLLEELQNNLKILQTSTYIPPVQIIWLQNLKRANNDYNDIIHKRILIQLAEIKAQIDRIIYNIIFITKYIVNKKNENSILIINRNIKSHLLKKKRLELVVSESELSRLSKLEDQVHYDISKRKGILQIYANLISNKSTNSDMDVISMRNMYNEEEQIINNIKNDLFTIEEKREKITTITFNNKETTEKIKNELIKIEEEAQFKKHQNEKVLLKKIKEVSNIIIEYKTLAETYLKSRIKINDTSIKFPKIALNPISIPKNIKEILYRIFKDEELEDKELLTDNDFIKDVDDILKEYTKVIEHKSSYEESILLVFIYEITILKNVSFDDETILKLNIIEELGDSLNIDKNLIFINNIEKDEDVIKLHIQIKREGGINIIKLKN